MLHTMKQAQQYGQKAGDKVVHKGPIALTIVSPKKGDGREVWGLNVKKDHASGPAFEAFKERSSAERELALHALMLAHARSCSLLLALVP